MPARRTPGTPIGTPPPPARTETRLRATDLTETEWQQRVIDTATLHGWRVHHGRPARTSHGWRTPIQGHPGFPDLVLARGGRVIVAELKSDRGRPSPDQRAWLAALGGHGRLWRPADWPTVLETLAA